MIRMSSNKGVPTMDRPSESKLSVAPSQPQIPLTKPQSVLNHAPSQRPSIYRANKYQSLKEKAMEEIEKLRNGTGLSDANLPLKSTVHQQLSPGMQAPDGPVHKTGFSNFYDYTSTLLSF